MLKGMHIVWGSVLYLGSIYALYGSKRTTFEDAKEIEKGVPMIKIRRDNPSGDNVLAARVQQWRTFEQTPQYAKSYKDKAKQEEAKSSFMKREYLR